jgi:hypothetical protein
LKRQTSYLVPAPTAIPSEELNFEKEINQLLSEKETLKEELAASKEAREVAEAVYISTGTQKSTDNPKSIIIKESIVKNVDKIVYPKANSTSVAFYCPLVMKEDITYEVRAMLGYLINDEQIKEVLLDAINETRKERREDPLTIEDINTKEVLLGEYLKIELSDPGGKFVIEPMFDKTKDGLVKIYDDVQKAFINQSFQWVWKITPKIKTKGEATLTLKITPYDKNMEPQILETRDYRIDITLKQGFIANTKELAIRNPEWALASIIAPIISFLFGIFFKREKKTDKVN